MQTFGIENFSASQGGIEKLKHGHGLAMRIISGESASVNEDNVEQWLSDLETLLKDYKLCDIFNGDETGLFFKMMLDKALSFKGEACHGGKKSKERLTILLCCNADLIKYPLGCYWKIEKSSLFQKRKKISMLLIR